jgi:AcrR family transcriptional regulator
VAIELFGTRGLRGTSIAAVAERLGMTDAGVLHYFPTKSALIDAAVARGYELQLSRIREYIAPGGLEALERMAAWGTVTEETPELTALQVVISSDAILESSLVREPMRRRYAAVHDLAAGLIRQGIERGDIRPDVDADWEASALVAYLDGIRLQWFYSDRTMPIANHVRRYVELLVERLRAPGTEPPVSDASAPQVSEQRPADQRRTHE